MAPRGFAPTASAGVAPLVSHNFSAWLEGYVTFDGEVLEQYHQREYHNQRQHVATIQGVSFESDGSRQYIQVRTKFNRLWMIPYHPEQRALATRLLHAVQSAIR